MNWWQYLLLVNIYLVLFYGFYVLLLRKETFFQLNRLYLVTAALLSFFIPLIQADWVRDLFITQQVKYTIYSSPVMVYSFKPIEATQISIGQILGVLYVAGILFLSVRLIWQLIKLKKVISQPQTNTAYSFFNKIKLDESNTDNQVIEAHEQVHARQWHSADVLLIELVMIINWFNPVVYMYRFAIKHIHEYIADRQAVQAGTNKADYALLLLSQTFNTPAHQLVNPFFNHSLLKQRIIMLQKNNSQRISLIKYGLSAPLFILMLILSSATINNSKTVTTINTKANQLFTTPAESITLRNALVESPVIAANDTATKKGQVFTRVDKVPEFPGGLDALGSFLGKNIRYPKSARDKGIQGKVIATFVVEKNGSLSDVRIARGVSKDIDDESLRVLRLSPNWKPGIQDKRKVRVQYSIPISFTLADNIGKSTPNKTDAVFTSVEQVPEFPGGLNEFGHFLAVNIKYPKTDREKGIQGKVIVTFVVEEDGSLSGLKVTRGVSKGLDDESVRVLKLSPNWKPGIQNGRKVRVQYSVPINFSLATDDKKSEKPTENKMGAVQEGTATNNLYASTGVRDSSSSVERVVIKGGLTQQPLYIVDGKEVSGSHFKQMDASTIESINVLKDKTATTIYGYKGVNGVIIVTSKNPKAN